MKQAKVRVRTRAMESKSKLHLLLLEVDNQFAKLLEHYIETRFAIEVSIANNPTAARQILDAHPDKSFVSVVDVADSNEQTFAELDILHEFGVPVIARVDRYEEDMRDQLIKHQVIDYIVKDEESNLEYIANLALRIHKNIDTKVLLVDDSRVSRFVLSRELGLQKFQVLQAVNAAEALALIEQHPDIRMALIDYQLPDTDGCTLVQQLRKTHVKDELLIIGLSTSTEPRLAVKFLKAGANDFIAKPFNYEMLLCRISQNMQMQENAQLNYTLINLDPVTRIYNRRYFYQQGGLQLSRLSDTQTCTVLILDIDAMTAINHQLGFEGGSEVLKHFANMIKAHFAGDIVARIEADKFAVISLSLDQTQYAKSVISFHAKVAKQEVEVESKTIRYTCSIAAYHGYKQHLDEMMYSVSQQILTAKQNGKNHVVFCE